MYKEKIVDVLTGEESFRDYTAEEIAQVEAAKALIEKENEILAAKEAKRLAALSKLEALGLDENDLKALGL